jgi:hypothetical protein
MTLASDWSLSFGLALTPLFESGEIENPSDHSVLLDGADGSFILSETPKLQEKRGAAAWAWSSNLPHHVLVAGEKVTVTKWNDPDRPEEFTLKSVADRLDTFYEFLSSDKVEGHDVVASVVGLFRSVRAEVGSSKLEDRFSVAAFLDVLSQLFTADEQTHQFINAWQQIRGELVNVPKLGENQLDRVRQAFEVQVNNTFGFSFHGALAVRHAASAIFQEAHFNFESTAQSDFFGYQAPGLSKPASRQTYHFTPPSLARSLVERAFKDLGDITARKRLVICDPACGSGAFLTEALRYARRLGFDGELLLVGRDTSEAAIAMAKFAVAAATHDWQPSGGINTDIIIADSLASTLPQADIFIMNPPFVAWPMMAKGLQESVREILGPFKKLNRPDLSMAFVTKAINSGKPGTVVATLLPASILSLDSAQHWRKDLVERSHIAFFGFFGDYGLFANALVQVAAISLVVGRAPGEVLALNASDSARATGDALRSLRRFGGSISASTSGKGWRLAIANQNLLSSRPWQVVPESIEKAISKVRELGMPQVSDLFAVRQGILTGLNAVFILTAKELAALPEKERFFFKPAIFRDAIDKGEAREKYYVFFPYDDEALTITSEDQLIEKVPLYFDLYLKDKKTELRKRSGINEVEHPWWSLSRFYKWVCSSQPRILSKYFGGVGAFVVDERARFIPVQSYAWIPKKISQLKSDEFTLGDSLVAYCMLFNSPTFSKLLSVFSPNRMSGGQFNLSKRFVNQIPTPFLGGPESAPLVASLSSLSTAADRFSRSWMARLEQAAEVAWGQQLYTALKEISDE